MTITLNITPEQIKALWQEYDPNGETWDTPERMTAEDVADCVESLIESFVSRIEH